MKMQTLSSEELWALVENLNFAQKVDRSLGLMREAYEEFGDRLVVANSLGKDSVAVWHLAKRVSAEIRGSIATPPHTPAGLVASMHRGGAGPLKWRVSCTGEPIPTELYRPDPDRCCDILK